MIVSGLIGFVAAKVLVEAIRRAGTKLTRASIQTALEGMAKFDLGGLEIGYSPTDHTGLFRLVHHQHVWQIHALSLAKLGS